MQPHEQSPSFAPFKPETVAQCHQVIDSLVVQLDALREQVLLLQERVQLNSRNSSKPPSSDGPGAGGAGGNRAQRRASERKRGAQVGHKGSCRGTYSRGIPADPPPVCANPRRQAIAPYPVGTGLGIKLGAAVPSIHATTASCM